MVAKAVVVKATKEEEEDDDDEDEDDDDDVRFVVGWVVVCGFEGFLGGSCGIFKHLCRVLFRGRLVLFKVRMAASLSVSGDYKSMHHSRRRSFTCGENTRSPSFV